MKVLFAAAFAYDFLKIGPRGLFAPAGNFKKTDNKGLFVLPMFDFQKNQT
jgi:hypothetical protein